MKLTLPQASHLLSARQLSLRPPGPPAEECLATRLNLPVPFVQLPWTRPSVPRCDDIPLVKWALGLWI